MMLRLSCKNEEGMKPLASKLVSMAWQSWLVLMEFEGYLEM